jgi:translocation and assembly module TamA
MGFGRLSVALALSLLVMALGPPRHAHGSEALGAFFDSMKQLWSGDTEDPDENQVQFSVAFNLVSGPADLKDTLEDASALVAQSQQGVPTTETLLALARQEPARLTAALYQQGYYGARIEIAVAGQPVSDDPPEIAIGEGQTVPVTIKVDPGPPFRFGEIRIVSSGAQSLPETAKRIADEKGLVSARPARSGAILETGRAIVADLKEQGLAFARIDTRDVTADHANRTVSVTIKIAPGSRISFGEVEVRGAQRFSEDLLRSRADLPVGRDYSPKKLDAARKRLVELEGIAGARVIEGEEANSQGRIPIIFDVTERKRNYFGANATVSSVDGAELSAYWGDRNLFGNGESLRLEGTLSNLGGGDVNDLEYEAKASLGWPSLYSAYTDYQASLSAKHEVVDSYESDEAQTSAAVIHRFSPELTGDAALQASWLQTKDAFGRHEFLQLSLPAELIHDTRDSTLDPTEGWRKVVFAEPVADLQNFSGYVRSRAQISTYLKLAATPGIVAAARLGAGTIAGADLTDVPAPDRFLAGGGGSVRGYAFRSVGPMRGNDRVGGLSSIEVSGELRMRVSDSFGVVPFLDAAFVSSDSLFAGDSETVAGVGLGLRYYSAIGPIRLDVATPLDRLDQDDPEVVVYVGLGQAF